MGAWANVAELVKTRTLQGGLVVRPTSSLPFLLEEGMFVTFVPPLLDKPKSARVEEISPCNDGSYLVYFKGVDTIELAEKLVGRYCLVKKADLPEGWDFAANQVWTGFAVIDDVEGCIGTVREITEMPGQLLMEVDGGSGTILIPIVDEFVRDVDYDEETVYASVPKSLIELGGGR